MKAMALIRRPRDNALLVSATGGARPFHRPLGVLENIYQWRGAAQHEIVFIFRAAFADAAAYEIQTQPVRDSAAHVERVIWRQAGASYPPLYPDGVAHLAGPGDYAG